MTKNNVPIFELKQLLQALKDSRPDICIRLRVMGEMWQPNFLRVIQLTEKGVALNDEKSNKLIFIEELSNVMQFELDQSFQQCEANNHYTVDPALIH